MKLTGENMDYQDSRTSKISSDEAAEMRAPEPEDYFGDTTKGASRKSQAHAAPSTAAGERTALSQAIYERLFDLRDSGEEISELHPHVQREVDAIMRVIASAPPAQGGDPFRAATPEAAERARFEAWAQSQHYCLSRDRQGYYASVATHATWTAWQAALACSEKGEGK